jgi:N-carbamoyl-L-amino-acid hydrolase
MTEIDTDAFLADLYALREIGRFRTGVHRPPIWNPAAG